MVFSLGGLRCNVCWLLCYEMFFEWEILNSEEWWYKVIFVCIFERGFVEEIEKLVVLKYENSNCVISSEILELKSL